MQYDEETAQRIIEKFDLAKSTMHVWKNRGSIPQKYFQEGFAKREKLNAAGEKLQAQVLALISTKKIKVAGLAQTTGIPYQMLQDVLNGKQNLSQQQLSYVRKHFANLRLEILALISKLEYKVYFTEREDKLLRTFLEKPELKLKYLVPVTDQADEYRIYDWRNGKQSISHSLKKHVLGMLDVFQLQIHNAINK